MADLTHGREIEFMSVLRIEGGRPLRGSVEIAGSKNAALAILSAIPLVNGVVTLRNVPEVSDVSIKADLLRGFGAKIDREGSTMTIDARGFQHFVPDEATVRKIRTGFYLLGPLLARLGHAKLPMPGGCKIGARPVDFHLKGLAILGAKVELVGGFYLADASGMKGEEIYLDSPSAGATQHLMATAALVEGCTTISNASMEPEVITLAAFLNTLGARIEGVGTSTITIIGVKELNGGDFRVPADRLQAGTYLLAGAITKGDVTVTNVLPENQTALINKLREAAVNCEEGADWVRVWAEDRPIGIRVKTMPYPGFPTDIQQPMAALLALATGSSVVEETIYESRTGHVQELNRMGANMRIEGRSTVIEGVAKLTGAVVEASDLRAGAALCLAALAAEGESIIKNVHFIDRGYENFEQNFCALGGVVERLAEDSVDLASSPV